MVLSSSRWSARRRVGAAASPGERLPIAPSARAGALVLAERRHHSPRRAHTTVRRCVRGAHRAGPLPHAETPRQAEEGAKRGAGRPGIGPWEIREPAGPGPQGRGPRAARGGPAPSPDAAPPGYPGGLVGVNARRLVGRGQRPGASAAGQAGTAVDAPVEAVCTRTAEAVRPSGDRPVGNDVNNPTTTRSPATT